MSAPTILCILDGWGYNPAEAHNAIAQANTPNWDHLNANFPHGLIDASEGFVGLPNGQMGNSEVGHMHIGAGRVVMQDLPRINDAIEHNTLKDTSALQDFITTLRQSGGTAHLMGLYSDGGVHAHQEHILALAQILDAANIPVCLHLFTDGRDTPPQSGKAFIETLMKRISSMQHVRIASLCGRYFAMDRDNRWDRVTRAYHAIVSGDAPVMQDPHEVMQHSYDAGKGDEFVEPTIAHNYIGMNDGDGVLMANFRADRAREILHALLDPNFTGFERKKTVRFAAAAGMSEYSVALNAFMSTLFPPHALHNTLGETVSAAGLKQLRIAETEKYAHVTFFLNGGREEVFIGEERVLIPSPDVATYDLKPEMSAPEVTDALVDAIARDAFSLIVVNFANTDMVGHTGNLEAAIKAVEAVDGCIGKLWEAVRAKEGTLLLTADHGNAESMHNPDTGQPHTAHTLSPVPFVMASEQLNGPLSIRNGSLIDVAPTVLQAMGLAIPESMTGTPLAEPVHA